jgi:hypothetical protein
MKRFAAALVQRLLVSVAVVTLIGGLGLSYGHFIGPSKMAYSASIILIAWPWALPQIFLIVCLIWFVFQHIHVKRRSSSL